VKFLLNIISHIEEILVVIMMAYMTIMNFLNVVFRSVASMSFSFTEELTVTVFVWVTMFGIALGFRKNAHLGMSYFVDHFHGKAKAILVIFSGICSLALMAGLVYYGIEMVEGQVKMGSTTPVLGMPQYVQGLSIPVGAFFVCIHVLEATIIEAKKLWGENGGSEK
jgi:C4-dicarboxylate transporter DctQ subunit